MSDPLSLRLEPIGVVHSPLLTAQGSPIQPCAATGVTGTLEIFAPFTAGLRDLAGFSRIWVLYWFHRASPAQLVVTPYRDTNEHGVFATRVPARPNPIGLSTVSLLAVSENQLTVGDLDLLNGSPILDIKPYVPEYDAYPSERAGWLTHANRLHVRTGDGRFESPR